MREIPKTVWILFTVALINRMGTMVLPFLSLHLTQQYALSAKEAGLVLSAYGLAGLVISPVAGVCSDRFGAMRVMFVSLLSSAVILFAFLLAQGPLAIAACTFLLALSNESFRPASMAVIGEATTPALRQTAFALIRLANNLGMGVGPLVGGLLYAHSFGLLPVVNGLAALLASLIFLLLQSKRFGPSQSKPLRSSQSKASLSKGGRMTLLDGFRESLRNPRLFLLIAAIVPALLVFFQHECTLPLYVVRELRLSEQVFSRVFLVNAILIVCLELPLNWQFSKRQIKPLTLLPIGAALVATGFALLAFTESQLGIALTTAIWTLGEMILLPASVTYVADISPPSKKGEYMGFYNMAFHIAFVSAPILGGALMDRVGGHALWGIMFGIGMASSLILFRMASQNQSGSSSAKGVHQPT